MENKGLHASSEWRLVNFEWNHREWDSFNPLRLLLRKFIVFYSYNTQKAIFISSNVCAAKLSQAEKKRTKITNKFQVPLLRVSAE